MRASIFEIARLAAKALRPRTPEPKVRGRIVKTQCEICGKTHGFVLGALRYTAPALSKIAATALLAACMGLSGCTHFYVSGVSVGVEQTADGKEFTAGVSIAPNPYGYKTVLPLSTK